MGESVRRECLAGWLIVEGRWVFVTADGSLTGASGVELSSLDDSTGTIRVTSLVGEIEQIEEPITSLDMLMWIEPSLDVAESIRAKEMFWTVNCDQI